MFVWRLKPDISVFYSLVHHNRLVIFSASTDDEMTEKKTRKNVNQEC